jgi:hypothetical protein
MDPPHKNMGPTINGQKWDGEPAFGMDGASFYFTSNRPGGFGGYDIWMVKETSTGHWSAPVNAGPGSTHPIMKEVLSSILMDALCISCEMEMED